MSQEKNSLLYGATGSLEDSRSRIHHFNETMQGYVIRNDGDSDLSIAILNQKFTVKPGEQFEEFFAPFSAVEIDTLGKTVSYRAYGRC